MLVEAACYQLQRFPRLHFMTIHPALSRDSKAIIAKVMVLKDMLEERDINVSEIVFDIPATVAGLHAAEKLTRSFKVNFTAVQELEHAILCAKLNPYSITFDLERMIDGEPPGQVEESTDLLSTIRRCPGLRKLHTIKAYFERHQLSVKLLVTGVRDIDQVKQVPCFSGLILAGDMIREVSETKETALETLSSEAKDALLSGTLPYPAALAQIQDRLSASHDLTANDILPAVLPHRQYSRALHQMKDHVEYNEVSMEEFEAQVQTQICILQELASVPLQFHTRPVRDLRHIIEDKSERWPTKHDL
ncbi:hypothetical protein M422DRAFT_47665 [Sphaerobolus stellatus SS14]|uniref:Transaldolase n=1 Tax=Sphaerobolus stellatus (strain SS14) TaxID=990650 RepID=A0A0C9VP33_SPHS4|nr:hypothetical protein M422DRAFT_47665 [Sphaerobolus stellatus SS14]